jgi:MtN3 and saliva related transmembrane protein
MDIATLVVGYAATTLSAIGGLPQVIKSFKTKDTKSVSLGMFIIIFLAAVLWLTYGILKQDMPMMVGNSIGVLLYALVLIMKIHNIIHNGETAFSRKKPAKEEAKDPAQGGNNEQNG